MRKSLLFIFIFLSTFFNATAQKNKKATKKYKYVTARSGLNFRQKPNGKILGAFKFRTKVEYLYSTDKLQTIKELPYDIEGTWVAIKHKNLTVFVFDYFLKDEKPAIDLFYAQEYLSYILQPSKELDIRQAFVNISEIFQIPRNFIKKKDLRKDTIHLNKSQRNILLKKIGYSNKDFIFIYSLETGRVKKYSVRNVPMMACVNIYEQGQETDYSTDSYQFGFNFGKLNDGGFAMIGRKNPFVEKGLKPIIFEKTNQKDIEKSISKKLIKDWGINKKKSLYKFRYKQFDMFLVGNTHFNTHFIRDRNTKKNYSYFSPGAEGRGTMPIRVKGEKACCSDYHQYFGKLFKNKGIVYFGFTSHSFGCESITVLDKKEKPIRIMCDNRH